MVFIQNNGEITSSASQMDRSKGCTVKSETMNDKRHLFRAFHPDENGETIITLNGEKIRGEWQYWNEFGCIVDPIDMAVIGVVVVADIIRETVGQWVTTDKNGKDVFEGDKVKGKYWIYVWKGHIEQLDIEGVVEYDEPGCCYHIHLKDDSYVSLSHHPQIELIGSKWEVEE